MGAFLHIGFVAKATTHLIAGSSKDKLLEDIEEYYTSDTYDCTESDGEITLILKPEVVQEELLLFVRQIYEDFHGGADKEGLRNELAFIHEHAGQPDWLEKVEEADLYELSQIDYGLSDDFEVAGKRIRLNTTIVSLGSEGKFLMEECDKTLHFMEVCAHRAYAAFRLGKAFRVFVF